MNTVRMPVSPAVWKRDGQAYFDRIATVVRAANGEGLVVVLAAHEDGSGLPGPDMPAFWTACATAFRNTGGVIFALYHEPSARNIPASGRAAQWLVWRNGGPLSGGRTAVGDADRWSMRSARLERAGDRRAVVSGCARLPGLRP